MVFYCLWVKYLRHCRKCGPSILQWPDRFSLLLKDDTSMSASRKPCLSQQRLAPNSTKQAPMTAGIE
jgi:hypothetical protein